jgi:transcriptional regulator with XRE-family HTH domain
MELNDMKNIRAERERQSLTQKRLAYLAGIDARTLRKIEKGEVVSPDSYRAVCVALKIDPPKEEFTRVQKRSPGYLRDLFGGILAICSFVAMPVFGGPLMAAYYADKEPNLSVVAILPRQCGSSTEVDVSSRIIGVLEGARFPEVSVIKGTERCQVRLRTLVIGMSENALLEKLRTLSLDVSVVNYTPVS